MQLGLLGFLHGTGTDGASIAPELVREHVSAWVPAWLAQLEASAELAPYTMVAKLAAALLEEELRDGRPPRAGGRREEIAAAANARKSPTRRRPSSILSGDSAWSRVRGAKIAHRSHA